VTARGKPAFATCGPRITKPLREEGLMSYPYPQDRHRDRREKGEQPYKDAKETLAESEVQQQTEAEAFGEARAAENEEERARRQQEAAQEAIESANESIKRSSASGNG
jgi:hypothetical protein